MVHESGKFPTKVEKLDPNRGIVGAIRQQMHDALPQMAGGIDAKQFLLQQIDAYSGILAAGKKESSEVF